MKYASTEFLEKYLSKNTEALLWTLSYLLYCHSIDDCIDDKQRPDYDEFLLKTFEFAILIYYFH